MLHAVGNPGFRGQSEGVVGCGRHAGGRTVTGGVTCAVTGGTSSGGTATGGRSVTGGVSSTGGTTAATTTPQESLHYHGRWNLQADRATTANSGSYISAQFTGTAITARFDVSANDSADLPTIAWRIDQSSTWQVAAVAASLPMGTGLSSGAHSITVIARGLDENKSRWSPPLVSAIVFTGFSVTGGALQLGQQLVQPKVEFLGDSITEGVVVEGSSYQGRTGQCWINDAVYSYATQTGMALGADYRQVGFGAQGLLKAGDGGVPTANDAFNWIYKDVPRDTWQADWVVINQGTNDSTQPAATFKSACSTFLVRFERHTRARKPRSSWPWVPKWIRSLG